MPQRGDIPVNNFVRGLVTEASPLTFPPGASLDEVNFELLRDGSRQRRLGLDLEDNYGLHTTSLDAAVLEGARCQAYRWSIPNGHIDQDIGVIQVGNQIWFIDLFTANPSANILNGGNPIIATELNNDVIMTFTTLNNYLIGVANQLARPYLFNYDPATDTVTTESADIAIRDMWGVDDGLAVDGRPTALTAAHHYNLLNQGWLPDIESTCGAGINAIDCTFNTFGIYPSNSDAWTYGRVEDLTSADLKKFDPDIAGRNFVNNGNVARGHYIISLYERGVSRSNQTGLTLPVDRETGRINAIASFAGRIFYAGILSNVVGGDSRSPNLSGTVLFSQLFENKLNLVKCYQEADPTSPDVNDIVDTDGGLIQIPECGYIWALKPIKESLFVFASNGVWEIRGGDNGFTATSFMVHKISNVGVYAPKSIVEVEGVIYFWAATGIHAIGRNENGVFQTTNLTIPTIQKLYNAIPDASKKNARGYYDLAQNRARWLYYSPDTKEFGEAIDIDEVPAPIYTQIGNVVTETSGTWTIDRVDCVALTADKYLICFSNSTFTQDVKGVIASVSGTSVTLSSVQSLFTGNTSDIFLEYISPTQALLVYSSSGTKSRVLDISGTTVTANAEQILTSSLSIQDFIRIDTNKYLLTFLSGGDTQARVISVSGTTVTNGAATTVHSGYSGSSRLTLKTTNEVWMISTAATNQVRQITISGTTVTLGTTYTISGTSLGSGGESFDIAMLNSNTAAITYMNGITSNTVSTTLTSNGTVLTDTTRLSIDTLGINSLPTNQLLTIYVKRIDGTSRGPVNMIVDSVNSSTTNLIPSTELTSTNVQRIRVKSLDQSTRRSIWVGRIYITNKLITQVVQIGE